MLPLKLIIKGLYSYQDEQIIDFTRLTDARLFGIFGAVGSGKSSILEAISFALYGETERLNKHDNRNYNMLNLKCDNLFIDFTFKAGAPENIYRSVFSCKRSKTFTKVSTISRSAYKKMNEEWIPMEVTKIPEIIGLSYDNFRRTIIIPQGKFSEFLQLGDKDRTEMLKEIFNLQRFEYYGQVASLDKKNNEKISHLKGKLEQIGEVSLEELQSKKNKREQLKAETQRLDKFLEEKIEEEKYLHKLKDVFNKLHLQKSVLQNLEQQRSSFEILEKDIKRYEQCQLNFKPLLDKRFEIKNKIKIGEKQCNEVQTLIARRNIELYEKEKAFTEIQKKFIEKEIIKDKAEELSKIISILSLCQEIQLLKERIEKGRSHVRVVEEAIQKAEAEKEEIRTKIIEKKKSLPDLSVLKEVNTWFALKKNILQNMEALKQEIGLLEKALNRERDVSERAIPSNIQPFFSTDEKTLAPDTFLDVIKIKREHFTHQQEKISKEIEMAAIQSRLEDFVSNLTLNAPCPLCGSTHHPNKLNIENVSFRLEDLKTKKSELVEAYKICEELMAKEQAKVFKIENIKNQIKKERTKLTAEEEKLEQHINNFIWKDFDSTDADQAEILFQKSQQTSKEIEKLEKNHDECLKKLEENQKNREKFLSGLHQLSLSMTNKESEQKTYQSQITLLKMSDFAKMPDSEIRNLIEQLNQEYNFIIKEYELLSASINVLKQEVAGLDGQLKETSRKVLDLKEEDKRNTLKINETFKLTDFDSIEEVESVLLRKIEVEKEKEKLEVYSQQFALARKQYDELQKEAADKEYREEVHQAILKSITEQKEIITSITKELGGLETEIVSLEESIKERDQLLKDLGELELRKEDLNVMKKLFMGSGFVNYVSTIFLQNLCNAANERFYKLTRQKLRLELENNNFQVRDFLNNGRLRSVKTLSGGQTFQASLSLALALAESIQQQNKADQNFFFLDEGFGSQDKESLNIVFETLKSLRKENRIVGIISHVYELQQEIDIYLTITNDDENGSLVKGSWEK